jgi:hypothetical protein
MRRASRLRLYSDIGIGAASNGGTASEFPASRVLVELLKFDFQGSRAYVRKQYIKYIYIKISIL